VSERASRQASKQASERASEGANKPVSNKASERASEGASSLTVNFAAGWLHNRRCLKCRILLKNVEGPTRWSVTLYK